NKDEITTECKVDVEKFTPILRIIKDVFTTRTPNIDYRKD
ncbi:19818_t:CDS:1, partial [Gigaspora rosea]